MAIIALVLFDHQMVFSIKIDHTNDRFLFFLFLILCHRSSRSVFSRISFIFLKMALQILTIQKMNFGISFCKHVQKQPFGNHFTFLFRRQYCVFGSSVAKKFINIS